MLWIYTYFCYNREHGIISVLFCAGNTGLFLLLYFSLFLGQSKDEIEQTAC